MSNYANYLTHTIHEPVYYRRNFERDLPPEEDWNVQRVALLVFPFLSLIRPLGNTISLGLGGYRCVSCLWGAVQAETLDKATSQLGQLALAVLSLAATVFNFTIGLLVTTIFELLFSALDLLKNLVNLELEKAGESFLQFIGSACYLAIFFSGSLEIILLSLLIQALLAFYQARHEFFEERYLEAAAKVLMGCIRCYQAKGTYDQIQRRNALFALLEFTGVRDQINKGRDVLHLLDSELQEMDTIIEEETVYLCDIEEKEYDFGANLHGHGKGVVKGSNLILRTQVVDGKKLNEVEFKVNHVFRSRLEKTLNELKGLTPAELQEVLKFSDSHATEMQIETVPLEVSPGKALGQCHRLTLKGLGSITVGGTDSYIGLYDRVVVRMEEGKNLFEMHELLSLVNLEDAIRKSTPEDMEKLKVGHLFRTFFPLEALPLERSEAYFQLPLESLKEEMIRRAPSAAEVFREELPKMEAREILPGRIRYAIPKIGERAHELGARALIASIYAWDGQHVDEVYGRVGSILKMGMLSTETRFKANLIKKGLSPSADFATGGSDSVFTQMVSEKDFSNPLKALGYSGDVKILFSLEALDTGTYQYYFDSYGERKANNPFSSYRKRHNIFDFTAARAQNFHPLNEVMIKERIPPSLINGLVVKNERIKEELLNYLRNHHLVEQDDKGVETLLNIPVDRFIRHLA